MPETEPPQAAPITEMSTASPTTKTQRATRHSAYDALNRLISAQNAGTDCNAKVLQNKTEYWGNSYGYDAWGNLLQKSITKCGAEHLSVTADAHNWLHASGTDYQYDAAGNMTYDATASLSYTFDQENRLTGAAGYTYTYDGDGNRVKKSNNSTGTLYWYMTPGIVGESDLSGNLTDEYVFFNGERVARKSTNGVFYYFSDHLKTASVVTDALGNIKSESDFYPWGGELQFVNNDSNHYKFTGKERDSETQLDYFGARYYSSGLGRFISSDWSPTPIPVPYADFHDPQSLNLYGYVRQTPTTRLDLDGHQEKERSPSGRVVTYTPDSAGRLVSAVDGNGTSYVTSASYNPDSSLKSLLNGSTPALNQNFQYTPRLQVCRITALTSGTLPTSCTDSQNIGNIMDRGYDFHAGNGTSGSGTDNGNVFAITNYRDTTRSQAFTYDALNRLTSGWSSANTGAYSWGENYSIDAWGNLQISPMGTKAHGGNFTLSGNAQNRPTGLAYDAAGNFTSYLSSTYTYDQENRLSSTSGMSYTYDGNGERVLKSNTSTGAAVKRYWSMGR